MNPSEDTGTKPHRGFRPLFLMGNFYFEGNESEYQFISPGDGVNNEEE